MRQMFLGAVFTVFCVPVFCQSEVRYPYFAATSDGGFVVVCRDSKGGIAESWLFPARVSETRTGHEESCDNLLSRKFRVQKSSPGLKTWSDAVSYCNALDEEGKSNWRLPSLLELEMLWLLGGSSKVRNLHSTDQDRLAESAPVGYLYEQRGFTSFAPDRFWSACESGEMGHNAWYVSFRDGSRATGFAWRSNYFRCVRDEW